MPNTKAYAPIQITRASAPGKGKSISSTPEGDGQDSTQRQEPFTVMTFLIPMAAAT